MRVDHALFFGFKEHSWASMSFLAKSRVRVDGHERASHRAAKAAALVPRGQRRLVLRRGEIASRRSLGQLDDDAHRPAMVVCQHQNDCFDEVRVILMRGRHQGRK